MEIIMSYKIILASASPRRNEILKNIGLEFEVVPSDADESIIDGSEIPINLYVQELALLKATDVVNKITDKENVLIIGADTVVYSDGDILGKPHNKTEAYQMMHGLSGKYHEVYTGFAVVNASTLESVCGYEKTGVKFAELDDTIINDYISTFEPYDKAGGYGIQGKGAILVEKIDGDYLNVVGLPARKLLLALYENYGINIINSERN